MRSLVTHGFLDVALNDSLKNICEILPHAREIARLGPEQTIQGKPWRFLNRSLENDGVYIGFHIGELYNEGTYGKIYKAHRMVVKRRADGLFDVIESPKECVIKRTIPPNGTDILPLEDITAHTSEGLLHVLAWQTMSATVTPWAIPQPYEVYGEHGADGWKNMYICMSYVNGKTLYNYMQKHWSSTTKEENSRSFIAIIAQLAFILHHLQQNLRMNHRDVKVNNVLIRRRSSPFVLELDEVYLSTSYELTLIDFGFACVGCPPPQKPMTVFQAGSWFPMGELCCKEGRDMAQLLYCIHCYFSVDAYLTPAVAAAVRRWMTIPCGSGTVDALFGFTKEGRPRRAGSKGPPEYHTGIYEFLRRADIDPTACLPSSIFKECNILNSELGA